MTLIETKDKKGCVKKLSCENCNNTIGLINELEIKDGLKRPKYYAKLNKKFGDGR